MKSRCLEIDIYFHNILVIVNDALGGGQDFSGAEQRSSAGKLITPRRFVVFQQRHLNEFNKCNNALYIVGYFQSIKSYSLTMKGY